MYSSKFLTYSYEEKKLVFSLVTRDKNIINDKNANPSNIDEKTNAIIVSFRCLVFKLV